jgi:succinyl-CoA synthetase alpha subunit
MSIILERATRIMIQGITTTEGRQHTALMLESKSEVVAGVSPGRYGQEVMGVPVYDKVSEAVKRHTIDASVIFVPKNATTAAALEAIEENIPLVIICTADISVTETIKIKNSAAKKNCTIIGPSSTGIYVPGKCKAGTISNEYITNGDIAIIARSIGNEKKLCQSLFKEELGESAVISLGGGDIIGTGYVEVLEALEKDEDSQIIVIGGETKGRLEEDAARFIKDTGYSKPVIAYIFGRELSPAVAGEKEQLFQDAGVTVVDDIWEIGQIIKESTVEE